ncbi:hypothetical protein GY45DRAFT_429164 [Cubamyces sp. BRFM 1775]|nr:hypothetical protein GY45DRAFT_429164 [Cubamyces sp. BRFM 1775]
MGYHRIMGYGCDFPLSQVGKRIFSWVIPGYGLREVCLKRESTVFATHYFIERQSEREIPAIRRIELKSVTKAKY